MKSIGTGGCQDQGHPIAVGENLEVSLGESADLSVGEDAAGKPRVGLDFEAAGPASVLGFATHDSEVLEEDGAFVEKAPERDCGRVRPREEQDPGGFGVEMMEGLESAGLANSCLGSFRGEGLIQGGFEVRSRGGRGILGFGGCGCHFGLARGIRGRRTGGIVDSGAWTEGGGNGGADGAIGGFIEREDRVVHVEDGYGSEAREVEGLGGIVTVAAFRVFHWGGAFLG